MLKLPVQEPGLSDTCHHTDDTVSKHLWTTMMRPLTTSEGRLFCQNLTRVMYVGHSWRGSSASLSGREGLPGDEVPSCFGEHHVQPWFHRLYRHHSRPALWDFGMESVSELKFVITPLAKLIMRTFEGMGRNDYFLTAALLREGELVQCTSCSKNSSRLTSPTSSTASFHCHKSRYIPRPLGGSAISFKDHYSVILGEVKVALWKRECSSFQQSVQLVPKLGDERAILKALGFSKRHPACL